MISPIFNLIKNGHLHIANHFAITFDSFLIRHNFDDAHHCQNVGVNMLGYTSGT